MNTNKLSTPVAPADLESLHGQSVIVVPEHSHHNPPAGVRGTILVTQESGESAPVPRAEIVLTLPDMATTPARKVTIFLSEQDIERLLRVEPDGRLVFHYEGELD